MYQFTEDFYGVFRADCCITPDRKPFRLTTLFRCGIIEDEKRVSSVDG